MSKTNAQIIAEDNKKLQLLSETNVKLKAESEADPVRNLCPKSSSSNWKYADIQYIIGPATNNKAYPECSKQFDTLAAANIKQGKGNLFFSTRTLPNGLTYNQCNPSNLSDLKTTAAAWGPGNIVASLPSSCSSSSGLFANMPISNNPSSEGSIPSYISPIRTSSNSIRNICDKKLGSDWKYTDIQYIVGPATGNQAFPECNKEHESLAAANFKKTGKNLVFPARTLPNGLTYTQCNPSTLSDLHTTASAWGPGNIVGTLENNCGKNSGIVAPKPILSNSGLITPLNKSESKTSSRPLVSLIEISIELEVKAPLLKL
jgi:hypothetical protein